MKRFLSWLILLTLVVTLSACHAAEPSGSPASTPEQTPAASDSQANTEPDADTAQQPQSPAQTPQVLVAYFSATGNTASVAAELQTVLDGSLFEIVPELPYTSEDLDYNNDSCRANQEQNDPDARPAISGTLEDPQAYDVIFLGYPIWWGQAPKILYTFLEQYDFSGKTIVLFCTSGSSDIGASAEPLAGLEPDATWLDGQRFAANASAESIADWVETLDLF